MVQALAHSQNTLRRMLNKSSISTRSLVCLPQFINQHHHANPRKPIHFVTKPTFGDTDASKLNGISETMRYERMFTTSTEPSDSMKVAYRMATADDYEDIMAIGRDLFDGLDYLPYTYHKLLNDPTWNAMCATYDGKVIGFGGANEINGGTTLMMRGGRILENFRRQGFMLRTIFAYYKNQFPEMVDFYGTLKSNSVLLETGYYKDPDRRVLFRKCVAYKFSTASLPAFPQSDTAVHDIDKTEMSKIFTDDQTSKYLFTDGFISARYVFMKPMMENMDILYRLADQRLASYNKESGDLNAMTLGVHFPCTAGYVYHMECYGGSRENDVLPHLYKHLKVALDTTHEHDRNADLYMFLYGRKDDYEFDWVDDVMAHLGGVKYELTYDSYIGLRNYRDDQNWQQHV